MTLTQSGNATLSTLTTPTLTQTTTNDFRLSNDYRLSTMKPPLMIAGFCREKCGGFFFSADCPRWKWSRWSVGGFRFRLYNV